MLLFADNGEVITWFGQDKQVAESLAKETGRVVEVRPDDHEKMIAEEDSLFWFKGDDMNWEDRRSQADGYIEVDGLYL